VFDACNDLTLIFGYAVQRLTSVLQALDEASEQAAELHGRIGTEGVYAFQSELLPHAIRMGQELVKDLRRLEAREDHSRDKGGA
jgi:hypothetical protein